MKINASSLAEVVIALAVIAQCFGVASLVFVRSTKVAANFQEIKEQTEIQSALWEAMHGHMALDDWDGLEVRVEEDERQVDSMKVIGFIGRDEKVIWKQQRLSGE